MTKVAARYDLIKAIRRYAPPMTNPLRDLHDDYVFRVTWDEDGVRRHKDALTIGDATSMAEAYGGVIQRYHRDELPPAEEA